MREGLHLFCVISRDQIKTTGVETLKRQFSVSYNDFLMVGSNPRWEQTVSRDGDFSIIRVSKHGWGRTWKCLSNR